MSPTHHHSGLSLTGRRWVLPETQTTPELTGVPGFLGSILMRRGVTDETALKRYLSPSLASLDDPLTIADMDRAVARLLVAIREQQPCVVFGDYDVDGVTSTALLTSFLSAVGARVSYYIPDRRQEGYGLNANAVRELAPGAKLLITVDCGITAGPEIALARSLGLDVIVVDHHQPGPALPQANANLDPHRSDCHYPFKDLCAAGVAFLLAAALRRALRDDGAFANGNEPDLREYLDLVALATVADMVPLKGTNRTFVTAGLKRIADATRLGLRALMEVAEIVPKQVTATDLGFKLGPRVNARGRVGNATEAVELLLTHDPRRAKQLAVELDQANRQRRSLEGQTVEAAVAKVEALGLLSRAGLVVADPSWHPGVLGLVATRLVARFHRPTIVVGESGKGSGRTFEGLDLHAAITTAAPLLERFGGHRAAAGVTVKPENLAPFADAFDTAVRRQLGNPPFVATLAPDAEIDADHLSMEMLGEIERLAPFGQANPEPLLVARNLRVRDKRLVGERHLKLRLAERGIDAIAFGLGELAHNLPDTVDVAFHLTRNRYNGTETLQLKIEDIRRSD